MKSRIKVVALLIVLVVMLVITTGCSDITNRVGNRITGGKDVQTFHYAYVYLGGQKIVEGYVDQWRDYTDSEAVQVQINGKYYLTEYTNVVLVSDPNLGWTSYSDVGYRGVEE